MTNEARDTRPSESVRNWQSVRTVLEMLILAGVLWLVNNVSNQRESAAEMKTQITAMREGMSGLQSQLSGIPQLSQSMARIEVKLDEHERRISRMEGGKP